MAVISSSSMGSCTIVGQQLTGMEWVCSPVRRGSRSQAAIGVVRRKSSGRWRGNSKSGVGGNEVQNHNGIAAISVLKLLQRWKADVVAGLNRSVASWAVRSSNYAVPLVIDDHKWVPEIFCRQEIRTATSSMTSVPKPLKFLRPHYKTLKTHYEKMSDSELKVSNKWVLFDAVDGHSLQS